MVAWTAGEASLSRPMIVFTTSPGNRRTSKKMSTDAPSSDKPDDRTRLSKNPLTV
jgi:hypothetical protein